MVLRLCLHDLKTSLESSSFATTGLILSHGIPAPPDLELEECSHPAEDYEKDRHSLEKVQHQCQWLWFLKVHTVAVNMARPGDHHLVLHQGIFAQMEYIFLISFKRLLCYVLLFMERITEVWHTVFQRILPVDQVHDIPWKGQVSLTTSSLSLTVSLVLIFSSDTYPIFQLTQYNFTVISKVQFTDRERKSTTSLPTNGPLLFQQLIEGPLVVPRYPGLLDFTRLLHWDSHITITRKQSGKDSLTFKVEALHSLPLPNPSTLALLVWEASKTFLWARWRPVGQDPLQHIYFPHP